MSNTIIIVPQSRERSTKEIVEDIILRTDDKDTSRKDFALSVGVKAYEEGEQSNRDFKHAMWVFAVIAMGIVSFICGAILK